MPCLQHINVKQAKIIKIKLTTKYLTKYFLLHLIFLKCLPIISLLLHWNITILVLKKGRAIGMSGNFIYLPVCPNPPIPLSVSVSSVTTFISACSTRAIII